MRVHTDAAFLPKSAAGALCGMEFGCDDVDDAIPHRTAMTRRYFILTLSVTAALPTPLLCADLAAYRWKLGAPLLNLPVSEGGAPLHLLDPAAVRADGMWHVFSGGAQYVALKELTPGMVVPRAVKLSAELFVPQVFFLRSKKQWQMIGQINDTTRRYPKSAPVLSTNARIDDPQGWTTPVVLDVPPPESPTCIACRPTAAPPRPRSAPMASCAGSPMRMRSGRDSLQSPPSSPFAAKVMRSTLPNHPLAPMPKPLIKRTRKASSNVASRRCVVLLYERREP